MHSQILFEFLDYGSMALVVAAIVVGVVMTRRAVRRILVAALVVAVLRFLLSFAFPTWIAVANEATASAYSVVQWMLDAGETLLLVAAAIVGALTIRAKDAAIAALVDKATPTWQQPKNSPDPKLLAD